MKSNAYTRKVDELGRVVFPIEIRRKFNIEPGDIMKISVEGTQIVMRKETDECAICSGTKNLTEISDNFICKKCFDKIKEM